MCKRNPSKLFEIRLANQQMLAMRTKHINAIKRVRQAMPIRVLPKFQPSVHKMPIPMPILQ
jgi:hypothetical protein